jgi:hypothetical protein
MTQNVTFLGRAAILPQHTDGLPDASHRGGLDVTTGFASDLLQFADSFSKAHPGFLMVKSFGENFAKNRLYEWNDRYVINVFTDDIFPADFSR